MNVRIGLVAVLAVSVILGVVIVPAFFPSINVTLAGPASQTYPWPLWLSGSLRLEPATLAVAPGPIPGQLIAIQEYVGSCVSAPYNPAYFCMNGWGLLTTLKTNSAGLFNMTSVTFGPGSPLPVIWQFRAYFPGNSTLNLGSSTSNVVSVVFR